jgi:hypothetical protein
MIHNLFAFFGADHKVGTTMITQSVAEIISTAYPNLKILLIAMNGRESCEYTREAPAGIDGMKIHIDNKMVNGEDFLKVCTHKGNFYHMAGISNEPEARYYYPDTAKNLFEEVAPEFDLVVADCGNELDNGLAVGTLSIAEESFFIAAQQETAIRRYEKNRKLIEDLDIGISAFIINKFYEQDPYGLPYFANRFEQDKGKFLKIESAEYSRQAEIDHKTLLNYKNEGFRMDIIIVANVILKKSGLNEIQKRRKSRWKSFI